MADTAEIHPPGMMNLFRKFGLTALAALQNRGELLLVELQEEKNKLLEMVIWIVLIAFAAMMCAFVLTVTIIMIVPEESRVYAAGGFAFFYFAITVLGLLNLKSLAKSSVLPFPSTVNELKKDSEWLGSLK